MNGICDCGCGEKTSLIKFSNKTRGDVGGTYRKYIRGHGYEGEHHPNWKGGRKKDTAGYVLIYKPDHPHSDRKNSVREHVLIVEKAIGRILKPKEKIHHANGHKDENRNGNLVLCEGQWYHLVLHRRKRAMDSCGHAHWIRCGYCHQYDDPPNLYISRTSQYHRACRGMFLKKIRAKEV